MSCRLAIPMLVAAATCLGCQAPQPARAPLPAYALQDPQRELDVVLPRMGQVRTISGQCRLRLIDEAGATVRLDGIIVGRAPDHLRLRASKMNARVLDLLLVPGGPWVLADRDDPRVLDLIHAIDADQLLAAWARLTRPMSDDTREPPDLQATPDTLTADWRTNDGTTRMIIDRSSLTVQIVEWRAPDGSARARLELGDYRIVDDVVWPFQLVAMRGGARLELELFDLELNADLPDAALRVPDAAWRPSG